MALSQTIDVTVEFNANNGYVADASGWDYLVWQFVNPTGTVALTATNDGGAIQGVSDGNSTSATNFSTVQAIKLSDGSSTATGAAGLFRVSVVGRYVKYGGASAAADKVIIEYFKIS